MKALDIRRELAQAEPGVHTPDLASTMNNLGATLRELRELGPAREIFGEALTISRQLAAAQPGVYRPDLAMALLNFGSVQLELHELAAARAAYQEALEIRRGLADDLPVVYLPELAMALNNHGIILRDLRELAEARDAQMEALEIQRALGEGHPGVYLPALAETLSNLGNTLRALGELSSAQEAHREALEIRHKLAEQQPGVYLADVATTLSNLGIVLRDAGEAAAAGDAFREALDILRQLAADQPAVYRHLVAVTLNNQASALWDLGDADRARKAYQEALDIYRAAAMWVDAVLPASNLGRIEKHAGASEPAAEHFEYALACLRQGLREVESAQQHDKFKSRLDDAAASLIEFYAAKPEAEESGFRLAGLFESLRRHELLDEIEGAAAGLLRDVVAGRGPLAGWLHDHRAAFLWMQAVDDGVVFAVVRSGRAMTIEVCPKRWMTHFASLLEHVQDLIGSPELSDLMDYPEMFLDSAPDRTIRRSMSLAFELLPPEVKDVMRGSDVQTIFVSACRLTIEFPLELLAAQPGDKNCFVGLRKVFARVHGLWELSEVIGREPDVAMGRRLVIGDPDATRAGMPRLEYALQAARDLAVLLRRDGSPAEEAYGDRAVREFALERLHDSSLGLFVFHGHGGDGSIVLAGGERLQAANLEGRTWERHPFIHLNCCYAGASLGLGGGRFEGLPAACLRGGAGAVLASVHPLYDTSSAAFSLALYDALLRQGLTLGEALLEARRTIDSRYGGNSLLWATSVLWGNPYVRLSRGAARRENENPECSVANPKEHSR